MKMIPIEELEALASTEQIRIKRKCDLYTDGGYFVGTVESYMGNVYDVDVANAALLAHCKNKFRTLLEAAKQVEQFDFLITAKFPEDLKGVTAILKNLYSAIQEASFVEVES